MSTAPEEQPLEPAPDAQDDPKPRQPRATRVAGGLWVVTGICFILMGIANGLLSAMLAARQPNRPPGSDCSQWLAFASGAMLIAIGRDLYRGKSKDVVTASIAFILYGTFNAFSSIAVALVFAVDEVLTLVMIAFGTAIGIGCALPGVMALASRSEYRAWRAARREWLRARRLRREAAEAAESAEPNGAEPDREPPRE